MSAQTKSFASIPAMSRTPPPPAEALNRLFHEPNRLAVVSALCAAEDHRLTFTELKSICRLTDGNLNRHLVALEEGGAVKIVKKFADRKPRTVIALTPAGLAGFDAYLQALQGVLRRARSVLPARAPAATMRPLPA